MLLWTLTTISGEPRDPASGFYQEFNAEESMAALKKMTAPRAKVRHDGAIPLLVLEVVKMVRKARR